MKENSINIADTKKEFPVFSSWLLWDSDPEKIDFKRDRNKIIRRVFEIGQNEDIVQALWYYTKDEIIEALASAAYLPENAILLAKTLFQLNPEDLKCYSSKQLHPFC